MNLRRYHLLEPIGSGSFGSVYRADMLGGNGFSKVVAVKILRPEVASRSDMTTRLRDEARLLALLSHRAILQVDGLVQVEGRWAVVMEYVEGVSLLEATSVSRVPLGVAMEILAEIASALHVAWNQPGPGGAPLRLVHRDIKPSNLLITAAGGVKLLDFGVARAEFQERESSTSAVLMGSYGYMAPERLDGVDGPEGDIYALGVVFYEMVVGERLGRTSSNPSRHAGFHQAAVKRFVRVAGDEAFEATELLGKMLDYDPAARPQARALETSLRRIMRSLTGESLSDWAERVVPFLRNHHRPLADGEVDLSGVTLAEQPNGRPPMFEAREEPTRAEEPFDYENHTIPIDPTPTSDDPPTPIFDLDPPSHSELQAERPSVDMDPPSVDASSQDTVRPLQAEPSFLNFVEAARVVRPGETRRDVLVALAALVVVLSVVVLAFSGTIQRTRRAQADPVVEQTEVAPPEAPQEAVPEEILIEPSSPMVLDDPPPTQSDPRPSGTQASVKNAASQQKTKVSAESQPQNGDKPDAATQQKATPPPPRTGQVTQVGDPAMVRLVGSNGSHGLGKVPAGNYEVWATFDGRQEAKAGNVTVVAGQAVLLECRKSFVRCTQKTE